MIAGVSQMTDGIETNAGRAGAAAAAIDTHTALKRLSGEAAAVRARDLITDVCHFLRLCAGHSSDDVDAAVEAAVAVFHAEVETDADGGR